jgi:hypothetical protein
MDALIVLLMLIALAIAALRWGYDSREGRRGGEEYR